MPVLTDAPLDPPPGRNIPELTVGELSGALKRTIEDRFGFVRVRGEISNYRGPHASGHAYFCLKDEAARIDAVIWKSSFLRLKTKPQEGLEVVATGRVTTFPGKSTYQIVIESLEPAGLGALMALLETRRRALAAEGLFDDSRKRALPFLPRVIGIVTSPTGAVIRDILHRLADRFPVQVLVWPVRVQGDTAAGEIAAAIHGMNSIALPGVQSPDVLLIARGGGSLEDLWAFNEEIVVRAAAASRLPLISAIGHETDWTLLDHVADLRAPTPTGGAEKLVPVRVELLQRHADLAHRLQTGFLRGLEQRRATIRALVRATPSLESLVATPRQRLDGIDRSLGTVVKTGLDRRHLALGRLAHRLAEQAPLMRLAQRRHHLGGLDQRLRHGLDRMAERRQRILGQAGQRLGVVATGLQREMVRQASMLDRLDARLRGSFERQLSRRADELARWGHLLDTLGYRNVLARGFALVRGPDGHPLRSVGDVTPSALLDIEFADGHIDAIVGGPGRHQRARSAAQKPPTGQQGRLF